jgi:hypothetical protein
MVEPNVTITNERLQHLLQLESSLPKMIADAITDYKKSTLKRLHEHDKQNPDAINARVKRYVEKHRDEINARRREKRLAEKHPQIIAKSPETVVTTSTNENVIVSQVTTIVSKPLQYKTQRAKKQTVLEPVSYAPILKENVMVVFGS